MATRSQRESECDVRSGRRVRRYRTRTTAWPAVADLMTALAVVGLACAILVAGRSVSPSSIDVLQAQNDSLIAEVDSLGAEVDSLGAEVDSLGAEVDGLMAEVDSLSAELAKEEIGFLPCWRGNDPGDYYRTYNITVRDGPFSFAPHAHWAPGTELRRTIPVWLVSVLEDFPQGEVPGEQVARFGERVGRALREAGYAADCRIAVTVNSRADGNEIGILTRAGLYPVWR